MIQGTRRHKIKNVTSEKFSKTDSDHYDDTNTCGVNYGWLKLQ